MKIGGIRIKGNLQVELVDDPQEEAFQKSDSQINDDDHVSQESSGFIAHLMISMSEESSDPFVSSEKKQQSCDQNDDEHEEDQEDLSRQMWN